MHYSSLFQYFFFRSTVVPTLVEIPNFWVYLFVNFFWKYYCYDYDSGTVLLLLMNPRTPHRNNGTACPTYVFIV